MIERGTVISVKCEKYAKKCVVIKPHGRYYSVLELCQQPPTENSYKVVLVSGEIFYTDLGKTQFVFLDRCEGEYDKVSAETMENLIERYAKCNGIIIKAEQASHPEDIYSAEVQELRNQILKLTAKCEVYEKLYKDLLEEVG